MSNVDRDLTSEILMLILQRLEETKDEPEMEQESAFAAVETAKKDEPVEMLTVKECLELVPGLTDYTIRQLVSQNKVPSIRAGMGKRGKILVSKHGLLHYLNNCQEEF